MKPQIEKSTTGNLPLQVYLTPKDFPGDTFLQKFGPLVPMNAIILCVVWYVISLSSIFLPSHTYHTHTNINLLNMDLHIYICMYVYVSIG